MVFDPMGSGYQYSDLGFGSVSEAHQRILDCFTNWRFLVRVRVKNEVKMVPRVKMYTDYISFSPGFTCTC